MPSWRAGTRRLMIVYGCCTLGERSTSISSEGRDVVAPAAITSVGGPGRHVVVAIGIDRYRHWRALDNAVGDALGAADLLHRLGFEDVVPPLLDDRATGEAIDALVTDELAGLDANDSLIVFYAGHGGTRTQRVGERDVRTGYLIPVDATCDAHRVKSWIELDPWLRRISKLPPRHILVILDACFSGIALSSAVKWGRDSGALPGLPFAAANLRPSRLVITSALDDERAMDSGPMPGHSLFTGCLIEALTGGLSPVGVRDGRHVTIGSELGRYVRHRVHTYDGRPGWRQTPDLGTFDFDERGEMLIPLLIGADLAALPRTLARGSVDRMSLPPPPASTHDVSANGADVESARPAVTHAGDILAIESRADADAAAPAADAIDAEVAAIDTMAGDAAALEIAAIAAMASEAHHGDALRSSGRCTTAVIATPPSAPGDRRTSDVGGNVSHANTALPLAATAANPDRATASFPPPVPRHTVTPSGRRRWRFAISAAIVMLTAVVVLLAMRGRAGVEGTSRPFFAGVEGSSQSLLADGATVPDRSLVDDAARVRTMPDRDDQSPTPVVPAGTGAAVDGAVGGSFVDAAAAPQRVAPTAGSAGGSPESARSRTPAGPADTTAVMDGAAIAPKRSPRVPDNQASKQRTDAPRSTKPTMPADPHARPDTTAAALRAPTSGPVITPPSDPQVGASSNKPPLTVARSQDSVNTAAAATALEAAVRICRTQIAQPRGAEVTWNGAVSTVPTELALPCGVEVTLTFRAPWRVPATRKWKATPSGQPIKVRLQKQILQVKVRSIPEGAAVRTATRSFGTTPTSILLPAGEPSTLIFSKDGFASFSQRVTPTDDDTEVAVTLTPLESHANRASTPPP